MSESTSTFGVALLICGTICFIALQVRGCNDDVNKKIEGLANQGVRAEQGPNGTIRVIDTRDFRSAPTAEGQK